MPLSARDLAAIFGDEGENIRILYGGSVKPENAATADVVRTSMARWSAAPASRPAIFWP